MVDPASISQITQSIGQGLPKGDSAAGKTPDASDVEKFENAMGKEPTEEAPKPEGVSPEQQVDKAAKIEAPEQKSMGDSILKGLENLRESHTKQTYEINAILNKNEKEVLSIQDTMRLQMEFMKLNLQQEMTTKVADKTGQGVQTLFKNQ